MTRKINFTNTTMKNICNYFIGDDQKSIYKYRSGSLLIDMFSSRFGISSLELGPSRWMLCESTINYLIEKNELPLCKGSVGNMKVSELIAFWSKKANLTPTCYTRYASLIKVIDGSSISHLDIKKLTHKTSQAFIDSLVSLGELSLSSIEQIKIILNSAFRYAVLNDLLDANPCSELKVEGHKEKKANRQDKVYLSDDEIKKIEILPGNLEVLIPLFTGLTAGEIVALKWQDIGKMPTGAIWWVFFVL